MKYLFIYLASKGPPDSDVRNEWACLLQKFPKPQSIYIGFRLLLVQLGYHRQLLSSQPIRALVCLWQTWFWRKSHRGRKALTRPILSHACPLIIVVMLILLQHQRQVILFDPMWPVSNACHWPYSNVCIMGFEESSWIFMLLCNWMLSMK